MITHHPAKADQAKPLICGNSHPDARTSHRLPALAALFRPKPVGPAADEQRFSEANLADDIALADIAAVAAMSPFHFSRAFATATGIPPYAYVIQRRIALAKTLLADDSEPVHLIAARCGFHSAGQFCRMFKRATGYSPLGFRP